MLAAMFGLLRTASKKTKPPADPVNRTLHVGGRALPLTIREHARATRITLRIEPGGRALKMTIPRGLHRREVDLFLDRHQAWLHTKLSKFEPDTSLRAGSFLTIRGVSHRIEHSGNLRGLTEMLVIDGQAVIRVSGLENHIGRRLSAFLKKEARADLERLAHAHARSAGRQIGSISLKDTRSRWGSCSWDGNLSFSWRIVMAPDFVIDYLAAHEVAHLREMNHGPKFWALCGKLCPRMDEARKWLRQHGSQLHAIDFE